MGWFWAGEQAPAVVPPPHPMPQSNATPPPSCPMHNKLPSQSATVATTPPPPPSDSACPYKPSDPQSATTSSSSTSSILSKLNPLNLMPRHLDNARSSTQSVALDLDREPSTIPRGDGSGTTWEYPSPQQMYNAMLRKGYADTPAEDVPAMVAVHNFLNEGAWQEILDWEARFGRGLRRGWEICSRGEANPALMADIVARREAMERGGGGGPRAAAEQHAPAPSLVRFMGRPDEPTPKARFMSFLGWAWPARYGAEPPFDRHDWFVRRHSPAGPAADREVRYVIDYYSGPPEPSGEPVFYLDVRPAVDGPTAACERLLRWGGDVWWRASGGVAREDAEARAKAA